MVSRQPPTTHTNPGPGMVRVWRVSKSAAVMEASMKDHKVRGGGLRGLVACLGASKEACALQQPARCAHVVVQLANPPHPTLPLPGGARAP